MINTCRLKGYMATIGYSQRKLAEAIGVNKNTLNAKINGTRHFDAQEIVRICEVLGIDNSNEKCEIFLSQSSQ